MNFKGICLSKSIVFSRRLQGKDRVLQRDLTKGVKGNLNRSHVRLNLVRYIITP